MYGTIAWLALLALAVLFELLARRRRTKTSTLAQLGATIASRLPGRVLLVLVWIYVGVHLFTRYTLPGH